MESVDGTNTLGLATARLSSLGIVAALACGCARDVPVSEARPNVLLVTIDTFRADRLGTGVAPALDRLAAASVRFTSARSAAPLTLPSHTTILTGLLPPAHGVRENGVDVLSDAHPTIARLLKSAGYETAAFVGAFVLDRRFGLAPGFDTYDDRIARDPGATERLEAERPASDVVDRAIAWLDRRPTSGPRPPASERRSPPSFFVWIHLYDPHAPYNPPARFRDRTKTAYDGEIAFADEQIARVFDWLRAHGEIEHTLIVFAGDHGEGLGDHGESTHGMLLYDSTLRVPLVIAGPGARAATVDAPVSLAEIAPTILRAAGVTPPSTMTGRNLLALSSAVNASSPPDLYSETNYPRAAGWSGLHAVTDGRWKTIRAGAATEVYDLQNDARETRDVAATQTSIAAAMGARANAIYTSGGSPEARSVSSDAQERLRALGYVAGSPQTAPASGAQNPAKQISAWNQFESTLPRLHAHDPAVVATLKTLADAHPDARVMQTTYAQALREAGHAQDALTVYRRAAAHWPTDAMLLHDLAAAARDAAAATMGKAARSLREEAGRSDAAALALDPKNAMAANGLGLLAIDEQRGADAVTAFQQATQLDATNASYWTNLGNARRSTGDRRGADEAYRHALTVDPRAADAANGIGVLLVEANRPADAVAWLQRATAAAPDFAEARLNLGIALQQSGQAARAADEYRKLLATHGPSREKDTAAKLLASLGGR
jgi:choline-sulfatase